MRFVRLLPFLVLIVFNEISYSQTKSQIPAEISPMEDPWEISILTCGAGPYVYALYGHTAIRVRNVQNNLDMIFNYGSFDMTEPNFMPKFILAIMDYELGVSPYEPFAWRYSSWGADVIHQVLNLTLEEKQKLLLYLEENAKPENKKYRYNFIFDNCCTRPRDILEKIVSGKIEYQKDEHVTTYREMVHEFNNPWPWSKLGVDLAFGQEADEPIGYREQEWIPSYIMEHFSKAQIINSNGVARPLVKDTFVVKAEKPLDMSKEFVLSPMQCALILLAFVFVISLFEYRRRRIFWGVDLVLFLLHGFAGLILFVLFFFSSHPTTGSNWLILFFNPITLVYLPRMIYLEVKRRKDIFHKLYSIYLLIFLMFFAFIPQEIPMVIVPLALTLLIRSINNTLIFRK